MGSYEVTEYEVGKLLHQAATTEAERQPLPLDPSAIQRVHLEIDTAIGEVSHPTRTQISHAATNIALLIVSATERAQASGKPSIGEDIVTALFAQQMGRWPWT